MGEPRGRDAGLPQVPGRGLWHHGGAVFSGPAPAPLMLVGQAPGVTEAQVKRPFNASAGQRLFQWLAEAGLAEADFRAGFHMTAVTKCYPGKQPGARGTAGRAAPSRRSAGPFLDRELALVQPTGAAGGGRPGDRHAAGPARSRWKRPWVTFSSWRAMGSSPAPSLRRQPVAQSAREPGADRGRPWRCCARSCSLRSD